MCHQPKQEHNYIPATAKHEAWAAFWAFVVMLTLFAMYWVFAKM